jgi:hypothetical protein
MIEQQPIIIPQAPPGEYKRKAEFAVVACERVSAFATGQQRAKASRLKLQECGTANR